MTRSSPEDAKGLLVSSIEDPNPVLYFEHKHLYRRIKETMPEGDHVVRHIYMDVPHSPNPKLSWYGESVGHYENGDTLVVDTTGLTTKTFVDQFRTPHSDKLHRKQPSRLG